MTHSFIFISQCPCPLLGQDLLNKLQATLLFSGDTPKLQLGGPAKACLISEEYLLLQNPTLSLDGGGGGCKNLSIQEIPTVWAEDNPPGLTKYVPPIIVQLTPGAIPI